MSTVKRLQNDMDNCEDLSDRKIPNDSYYIIYFKVGTLAAATDLVKKLLRRSDNVPLAGYVYHSEAYVLFSSVETGEHFLQGNHHSICSKYTSIAVLETMAEVDTKIVELDTRTKVVIYLYNKVCEGMKKTLMARSKGTIDAKDLSQYTFSEVKRILLSKAKVVWDDVESAERFGTIYKYISSSVGSKAKYTALSEMINLNNIDRYMKYLFE